MVTLNVNGAPRAIEAPDDKPLLWVLREDLGLRGAKYSCGKGLCGACTVLVDGGAVRSCVTPVATVGERSVTTIEGLADPLGVALKAAWRELKVAQCGYCQTGQIMAAHDLLSHRAVNDPPAIKDTLNNLCRCATYNRIHQAIEAVAAAMAGDG